MKLQTLLSSAALLLTAAVPALAEEPARAVAQPIEAFEDVLVSAGLYDPEDDEEDSYDMEGVAKKDDEKSDKKKKKSKKSNKKKSDKKKSDKKKSDKKKKKSRSSRNRRRKDRSYYRRYKKGYCRNPKGRRARDVCDEIEDRFCSGRRQLKQNRQFCRDLGFKRSVTDEEWALIDTEEFLPEEYDMLIDDVAEDIDDSSMDSEDEDSYDSYDDEDEEDSYDSEDSGDEDLELEEKDKGGGSKGKSKGKSKSKGKNKKKDSKKKESNKKSKKSNKRNKRSSRSSSSSSRSSRSCFDRSRRSSCEDSRRCEWFKTSSGGFCIEASSSSDYDFAEE